MGRRVLTLEVYKIDISSGHRDDSVRAQGKTRDFIAGRAVAQAGELW